MNKIADETGLIVRHLWKESGEPIDEPAYNTTIDDPAGYLGERYKKFPEVEIRAAIAHLQ